MKEKLVDIVESIISCAEARKGTDLVCVARINCLVDGKEKTYWFTTKEMNSYMRHLKKFGEFVYSNSDLAIEMQKRGMGSSFDHHHKNNLNRIQTFHIVLENHSNFQDHTISIAQDPLTYQYKDIHEFLHALQCNRTSIDELETEIKELERLMEELSGQKSQTQERERIKRTINDLQTKYRIYTLQQKEITNVSIYIRKQGEMRYSLIVDTKQTCIKAQNLFDGRTIIIDGGPGTGKSTTMIHRLAYLTDTFAIKEDYQKQLNKFKLNNEQRKNLLEAIEKDRDWMFFSPSPILRTYLAEAMLKEGLKNTFQKVWHWREFCTHVLQNNYRLLETSTRKASFSDCYYQEPLFYQNSNIAQEFTEFFVAQIQKMIRSLPSLDTEGTVNERLTVASQIKNRLAKSETYTLAQFISLFQSLEMIYGKDCKRILQDSKEKVKNFCLEIHDWLNVNQSVKDDIKILLDITLEENEDIDEIENEEETNNEKGEEKLIKKINKWLKHYCLHQADPSYSLSEEEEFIRELLQPFLTSESNDSIRKMGEIGIFEQYAQYTKGIPAILLSGLAKRYKAFRRYLSTTRFKGCNLQLLKTLEEEKSGKQLHFQEQALLLGFINNLVKQIKSVTHSTIKHNYIDAFEELNRPVLGIDEATDFSCCEIYAMQSFLSTDFNSLTLCGDTMQRLTQHGIHSWSELDGVLPNPLLKKLTKSYRQSTKLIKVAKHLYNDTIGKMPNYSAYMTSTKVPEPLVFIEQDESTKIQWISQRIDEAYRNYGKQLPSIAIFVNDKGSIPRVCKALQQTPFFLSHQIQVHNGLEPSNNQEENHISVYPIEVVKGMEFDVVFFHNLDRNGIDDELLKRYIYVGVSRAAFFLAITLIQPNTSLSKYFKENDNWA